MSKPTPPRRFTIRRHQIDAPGGYWRPWVIRDGDTKGDRYRLPQYAAAWTFEEAIDIVDNRLKLEALAVRR